jgi:hypothetical protein
MKGYIKTSILIFAILLIGFNSCKKETYSLGDLPTPSNLVIVADIAGKTADAPNGDGSGVVNFNFTSTATISYKVDFGDGSAPQICQSKISRKYNKVGTKPYRVMVTALGKGGITSTSMKDIVVYYAFDVDPAIVTLLTGNSPTGKKWRVDKDVAGHLGLGPGADRPDGNAETFIPSWWAAQPNEKVGKGIYDDVYTFTSTKVFTHQTNGDLYGYKEYFARDFDPATPGVYGGYGDEWILNYPDYTESFDYDGDKATSTSPKRDYITFSQKGHCGFFSGFHKYMILEITDTTMWLRADLPGTNINAWYVKLIVVE